MTPPDTNVRRQTRRHIFPLIGMIVVVVFGVGLIMYWVGEEIGTAPAPDVPVADGQSEQPFGANPGQVESGDVNVPQSAPTQTVDPNAATQPAPTTAPGTPPAGQSQ